MDQTLEETINKDTQTPGGTRGFSLNKGAVARYYLTAEYRTAALRTLRDLISSHGDGIGHPDLQSSRFARDKSDVASIIEMLGNNWTNPFGTESSDIVSISTGAAVPTEVALDLLNARRKGEEAYTAFAHKLEEGTGFHDPIKKVKLESLFDAAYFPEQETLI